VRPGLHRRAAEAIEAGSPGEARRVAALAYHWVNAEDTQRAIDYLEKAGQQALENYASEVAIAFYGQALELGDKGGAHVGRVRRARWKLRLGEAYVNQSRYVEGREHLTAGLALLGRPMPGGKVQSSIRLLGQLVQQILHRLWPNHYVGRVANRKDRQQDISRAYEKLIEVYTFTSQVLPTVYAVLAALNTAEAVGPCPELARGYASSGAIMGLVPLHRAARAYLQRALDVALRVDDPAVQSHAALYAGLYYAGVGDWARTEELWNRASEISEQLGDHRAWESSIGNRAIAKYLQGDLQAGLELANQAYLSSCQRNVSFFQATALNLKTGLWLSLGHLEQAIACLERARSLAA